LGIIDKATDIFLVGALVPAGLSMLYDANTTGWDATTIVLWGVCGIMIVVGLFKKFTSD
jgi:RsiW-degrading membrane proteinase PrsW (M82 family)